MPKVSDEYLDARRSEILDAAVLCFSREGFHRTTIKDIVRESGLSPGAIYNYFHSKEEMIDAIAARRTLKESEILAEGNAVGSAGDALVRVIDAFLEELRDNKQRMRRQVSVQLWAEAQRSKKVRKIVRRNFEVPHKLLSELLTDAQDQGAVGKAVDPATLAAFMIAVFHGLVLQREWDERFSVEAHKTLLQVLLRAIAPTSKA